MTTRRKGMRYHSKRELSRKIDKACSADGAIRTSRRGNSTGAPPPRRAHPVYTTPGAICQGGRPCGRSHHAYFIRNLPPLQPMRRSVLRVSGSITLMSVPVSGSTYSTCSGLYGRFSSAPRHGRKARKIAPFTARSRDEQRNMSHMHPAPQGRFTATTVTPAR